MEDNTDSTTEEVVSKKRCSKNGFFFNPSVIILWFSYWISQKIVAIAKQF
jgi:hypothetical protein